MGDAVTIGTAQALALWPGVSRSGITITAGLFRRFTREAATRFSFLLSAPLIAGAVVSKLPALIKLHKAGNLDLPLSDPGDQRRRLRRRGLLRHRLLLALFANTHPESIYCLPLGVWYHRFDFGISSGGPAIAPTGFATTQPSPNAEENFVRFLTPTDNKRLNELIGFLCIIAAILMGLALITYQPQDIAFNVSGPASDGALARNWIGPVGAYGADLLFQVFGFAAFLLPVALLVVGMRWFRSRSIDSQTATVVGIRTDAAVAALHCSVFGTCLQFAERCLLVGCLAA